MAVVLEPIAITNQFPCKTLVACLVVMPPDAAAVAAAANIVHMAPSVCRASDGGIAHWSGSNRCRDAIINETFFFGFEKETSIELASVGLLRCMWHDGHSWCRFMIYSMIVITPKSMPWDCMTHVTTWGVSTRFGLPPTGVRSPPTGER